MGAIGTLIFSYIILILLGPTFSILQFATPWFQTQCLSFFDDIAHTSLHQAFWCGQKIESYHLRTLFQKAGLYHILIISGWHISLMRHWGPWAHPKAPKMLKLLEPLGLIFYALIAGSQPPVIRALLECFLPHKSQSLRIFLSFIFCLALFPAWAHSLSFALSLIARLLLALVRPYPLLVQQGLLVLGLSPAIYSFNWLAGPLSLLLLPPFVTHMVVLAGLHILDSVGEFCHFPEIYFRVLEPLEWALAFTLKKILALIYQTHLLFPKDKTLFLWSKTELSLYISFLFALLHGLEIQRHRQSLVLTNKKKPKARFLTWPSVLLFFWFSFHPQPMGRKDDIPSLNPSLPAHNKHNHRRHLTPFSKPRPFAKPLPIPSEQS